MELNLKMVGGTWDGRLHPYHGDTVRVTALEPISVPTIGDFSTKPQRIPTEMYVIEYFSTAHSRIHFYRSTKITLAKALEILLDSYKGQQ